MKNRIIFGTAVLILLTCNAHANGMFRTDTLSRDSAAYTPIYDFIPEHNYELVADKITCITEEIPMTFNSNVFGFITYFGIRNRDYTRFVIKKKDIYFPLFEKYLAKYEMPDELKYLSIVESGLEPRAISRAGAGGLWQFMPYTGRSFGLHQDFYIDDRFDPDAATEAACKYLKSLYKMFGDWELALAAYNSGPGNVRKAIRKSGYQKGFWKVYRHLPRETRSYVPQFVAIKYVLNYADDYNLHTISDQEMESDTLMVSNFVNLKLLADEINVCYEDLDKLNPAIKRFALPASIKKYPIRIPIDKIEFARENRHTILTNAAKSGQNELALLAKNTAGSTYGRTKVVHRVRSGDVLGTIAQNYHVRIGDIKRWNNLGGNMIRIGQRLNIWLLPSNKYANTNTATAANAQNNTTETTTSGMIYNVQPGDTLWDISRKYDGLSIEKIKKLNNLKSNNIKPGQKLIIG